MPEIRQLPTYTLRFINETRNTWSFCVYLSPPLMNVPDPMAIAWLTADAAPTTHIALQWKLEYGFMWMRNGVLSPGNVTMNACQSWPADLDLKNQVTYTTRYKQPTFSALTEGPNEGNLYIHQDRKVDAGKSLIGFSIAGLPVCMVPAQPNVDLIMTPAPEYWVTFGKYTQGQSLDLTEITNSEPVVYLPNCYDMIARLRADNTWLIEPINV